MSDLHERFEKIRSQIEAACKAAGRSASEVTLIAVSKTQPAEMIEEAYRLGQRDFGENYVQEMDEKAAVLENRGCVGIRWHFIGHLQSNKARDAIAHSTVVHAVSSEKLAIELSRRATRQLEVFIQVNIDREETKSGVSPEEAPALAARISALERIELLGLMCIPSPGSSDAFKRLRDLELKCRPHTRGKLSMGMSQDFEQAIGEGATHVRVGTSIFGSRPSGATGERRAR